MFTFIFSDRFADQLKCHQTESKHGTRRVDHDDVDLRLKLYQNTELDGIQSSPPKSRSVAGEIHLAPDAKVWCVGSNRLQHRNIPLEFYQKTEFNGIRKSPPKSESVADNLYLASNAKVSCVVLNGLKHRDRRLELYQNTELDRIRKCPSKIQICRWRPLFGS